MGRERLDNAIVARGLVASRSRARDLIVRGFVTVDGVVERRAARPVSEACGLAIADGAPDYVSRGAEKLEAALEHFAYPVAGVTILDAGASTGGFVEVLLRRDAQRVIAVDVGRSQLHARLSSDARVENLEQTDVRSLTEAATGGPVDALVADLSFISLEKALPSPLGLVRPGGWMIALIKPQFEAGPDGVGKDGVVRDDVVRQRAVRRVHDWLVGQEGWRVDGVIPSPIAGGSGNEEFLIGARRDD